MSFRKYTPRKGVFKTVKIGHPFNEKTDEITLKIYCNSYFLLTLHRVKVFLVRCNRQE